MPEQGCSRLSPSESGRILDRLAGLEKIMSKDLVSEVLPLNDELVSDEY